MISFRDQIILIIYFLLYGMFLSAIYDVLQFYLNKTRLKKILIYFIQVIFWILLVFISCLYMLEVSSGYLTIYTFGCFFLGVLLHFYFLHSRFVIDLTNFQMFFSKIYKRLKKTIIILVFPKEVFQFIKKIIKKMCKPISKIFKKIIKRNKEIKGEINDNQISKNLPKENNDSNCLIGEHHLN